MKTFILFLLIVFSCFISSCGGEIATKSNDNSADIDSASLFVVKVDTVEQQRFDTIKFGRVMQGETFETHFIVENVTDKHIAINSVVTGCGCIAADYNKKPLAPSEKRIIKVNYNSKGQFGTQIKAIEIVPDNYKVARIYVTCNVIEK